MNRKSSRKTSKRNPVGLISRRNPSRKEAPLLSLQKFSRKEAHLEKRPLFQDSSYLYKVVPFHQSYCFIEANLNICSIHLEKKPPPTHLLSLQKLFRKEAPCNVEKKPMCFFSKMGFISKCIRLSSNKRYVLRLGASTQKKYSFNPFPLRASPFTNKIVWNCVENSSETPNYFLCLFFSEVVSI